MVERTQGHGQEPEGTPAVHRRLLARIPAVLAVIDATGVIRTVAGGTQQFVGLSQEEVVGRPITDFVRAEDIATVAQNIEYATTLPAGTITGPLRVPYRHADGTWRVTEVWSSNTTDDPEIGGIECLLLFESAHGYLDEVLTSMAEGHPLDRILPMLAQALSAFPVMSASLFVEVTADEPRFHVATDRSAVPAPGLPGPWDDVLATGVTVELSDTGQLPEPTRSQALALGFRSVWVYPVYAAMEHRLAAALVVWRSSTEPPTSNQRHHIERAVTLASLAFGRRMTEQALRDEAFSDPLTGVANRRLLRSLASEHEERRSLVALLYVDLDGFKAVNDVHGHVAGDTVLAEVARRISTAVRPEDHVVRLGGDEFAIVCTSLEGPDEAVVIAERVIEQISRPVAISADCSVKVGASVGIACSMSGEATFDEMIRSADEALYSAKERGRGTWSIVGSTPGPTEQAARS
jgi:diguanylate cyclase (GGDEF)-like protein/PAS domain S-box-containing protein